LGRPALRPPRAPLRPARRPPGRLLRQPQANDQWPMTNDQGRAEETPRSFQFAVGRWPLVIGHWSFRRCSMSSTAAVASRPVAERALDVLRRAGNPFRNFFARNPDDEVCARYHVPELFSREREQLLGVVDLYRFAPATHSEVVPVLGNKGSGKTHLLHS